MRVLIWLTSDNGETLSTELTNIDKTFEWETQNVPAIGDTVSIDLEHLSHLPWAYNLGWIDGKVVEREFKTKCDEVELTLEIERSVGEKLRQVKNK